jgi:riboflavin kinase/FMN adenylyltransferase
MPCCAQSWSDPFPEACRGGAVTIGNFDGVHVGHQALLAEAVRQARICHGPAVAVCFDPHPLEILRPEIFDPVLTTPTDRALLLEERGADQVILLRTTREMLNLRAAAFFQEVIVQRLDARALVEGENFGFGQGREGNVKTLAELCRQAGLSLTIVPPVLYLGKPVSSSRVRRALLAGDVRTAAAMLGRPYRLRGRVGTGQQRGKLLGVPTANLAEIATLVPGDGVYAVRVGLPDGASWPGAANIGPNPTFGEQARKVEVHLIGFSGDLVGHALAVEFVERLRDTRAFANKEELVEQLQRDIARALALSGGSEPAAGASGGLTPLAQVALVLEREMRPLLGMEGLAIEVVGLEDGVARLRLEGACTGCPSSIMAMMMFLEQELRKRIPDVEYVQIVP